MSIWTEEAEFIAEKLNARFEERSKHKLALIQYDGQTIARYGIRRSSKSVPHRYVPRQIRISPTQAESLAQCSLSKDEYFDILRERKIITDPPEPTEE